MTYRPITDVWFCARPKVKFYGAFPSGFLDRARSFLCREDEPLLHVCAGRVRDYPFAGFGSEDRTLDLDPETKPDFLMDVRELADRQPSPCGTIFDRRTEPGLFGSYDHWPAALVDRPYTEEDARHYAECVRDKLPNINVLLRDCLSLVRPGGRVGVLDYFLPRPPKVGVRFVAAITVHVGYGNRPRCYSVFERTPERTAEQKRRVRDAIRGKLP